MGRHEPVCQSFLTAGFLLASLFSPAAEVSKEKLAILPVKNISPATAVSYREIGFTKIEKQYDYIGPALVDMLFTDLFDISGISIIERSRVDDLLNEILFGETGIVSYETAAKAGRALNADKVMYGTVKVSRNLTQIELSVHDLRSGLIHKILPVIGNENELLMLEEQLCGHIKGHLRNERIRMPLFPRGKLAILPFHNNSKADIEDHYRAALQDYLYSEFAAAGGIKLVERGRVNEILSELALGHSGMVDERTAARAGRLLGADQILFGSYVVVGGKVRIDLRFCAVETGQILLCAKRMGTKEDILAHVNGLVREVRRRLR